MEDKNLDNKIKESLVKNTNSASERKEDIWENIEAKLFLEKNHKNEKSKMKEANTNLQPRSERRKKSKKSKRWLIGTIAAALLLGIFTTSTDTGQAFVNNIKDYFVPQKQVVEEIEGMPEEKEVVLQEGKAGYIIYIDEERYELVEGEGTDTIVFKGELGDNYPEVSMSITQVEAKAPAQLAEEISTKLKNSYETVKETETVTDPVGGLLVSAIDGNEWNSPITRVYIVSNEKKGSFVIQQKFFVEAEEGHGARFHQMLKEFKVVELTEDN